MDINDTNSELVILVVGGLVGLTTALALNGKIIIDSNLNILGQNNMLAIGDMSLNEKIPYPVISQFAMQKCQVAVNNVIAYRYQLKSQTFKLFDFGEMLSLDRDEASITGLGLSISGPIPFQIRRIAYLTKMQDMFLTIRSAGAWLLNHSRQLKSIVVFA